jgi:hypothetical protein
MLLTTVNLALPAELRQKIRDACGLRRPGDPAPKSRRVWRKTREEFLPMGWMRMNPAKESILGLHLAIIVKERGACE